MPQVAREPAPTARGPPIVPQVAAALVGPVAAAAVEVEQDVHLAVDQVVAVRRRALDLGGDGARAAARARPAPEQARRAVLHEDVLAGLVLHEAHVLLVVGVRVQRQDVQVDDAGRAAVDVRPRGCEGPEVARVGVADADAGRGPGVSGV